MLITMPDILDADALAQVRALTDSGEWIDGKATSGLQAMLVKNNAQLPESCAAAQQAGRIVLDALARSASFVSAALPLRVYPPLFNRYAGGQAYGGHIDNAVRIASGGEWRMRSDLSATLFLEHPDRYEGGELVVAGPFGEQRIKLPAGQLVLYPSSSLHRVEPVTAGVRTACVFWVQSMVRDADARRLLYEADGAIQSLGARVGQGDAAVVTLTGVYHNLLRRWAEM